MDYTDWSETSSVWKSELPPELADTEAQIQSKLRESVKEKKVQKRYDEEFKRLSASAVKRGSAALLNLSPLAGIYKGRAMRPL